MVNLPKERITSARPFRYCVVYLFGSFLIKQGMKEVKRHRVLFTCLASRGVHIKTAHLLEINSFMNTVRKFIARWWPVCKIRSDQRTNIVGPQTELKKALEEMDHDDIPRCPSKDFTEWVIKWKTISRCDSYGWRLGILMTKSKIMMLSPSTFQKATVYLCRTANSAILLFKTLCVPNADN